MAACSGTASASSEICSFASSCSVSPSAVNKDTSLLKLVKNSKLCMLGPVPILAMNLPPLRCAAFHDDLQNRNRELSTPLHPGDETQFLQL